MYQFFAKCLCGDEAKTVFLLAETLPWYVVMFVSNFFFTFIFPQLSCPTDWSFLQIWLDMCILVWCDLLCFSNFFGKLDLGSLTASLVAQLIGRPRFNPWVGKIPWRREWLHIPVFWPGESHGLFSPWGRKESDTTEWLSLTFRLPHILVSLFLLQTSHCWSYMTNALLT